MSGFGSTWLGSTWFGSTWMAGGGGGGSAAFAMNEQKSLLDEPGTDVPIDVKFFPDRYWDPDLLAQVAVLEFMKLDWQTTIEKGVASFQKPKVDDIFKMDNVKNEITALQVLVTTKARSQAAAETIQQDQNFQNYWLQLMMINRQSHPNTFLLMKIAARIGEITMIHFKHMYKRPRPSQICPALMPLLEVPGHASFPSGHSLMAHLTSNCLIRLVGGAYKDTLEALAHRVAHNRELAGLHYPSDSVAGEEMAAVIHDQLLFDCQLYSDTFDLAKKEWP